MAETTADGVAPEPAPSLPDALTPAYDARTRDPVRLELAEALARRAAAHAGEARRLIDERVAEIMRSLSALPAAEGPARRAVPTAGRAALAALVADAARHRGASPGAMPGVQVARSVSAPPRAAASTPVVTGAAADAKTVQFFKRTWSRLSADQRLAQSRAALPENAGPLNSQHLVHRSLVLMRELSPEYLEHFVGYVDALQWLAQANEAATQELSAARAAQARPRSLPARR